MKNKVYTLYGNAVDSNGENHVVTVVGLYNQNKQTRTELIPSVVDFDDVKGTSEGLVIVDKKERVRTLSLACSICHPTDEFNKEIGIRMAKSRAKRTPIATYESKDVTALNEDACTALVFTELRHIINNIDKYIG